MVLLIGVKVALVLLFGVQIAVVLLFGVKKAMVLLTRNGSDLEIVEKSFVLKVEAK